VLTMLRIEKAKIMKMSIKRPNLNMKIVSSFGDGRFHALLRFIADRKDKNGIIYCTTRKKVRRIYHRLNENNIEATWYHGDYPSWRGETLQQFRKEKEENFRRFMSGETKVMVATTAFGMGVNKGDIHYILHFQMPLSIESYYQAAGRGGRNLPNKESAESVVYYVKSDYRLCHYIITNSNDKNELDSDFSFTDRKIKLLDEFVKFTETDQCLQQYICRYFGEETADECGNCNCCHRQPIDDINDIDEQLVDEEIATRNKTILDRVQELDKFNELEKREDVWKAEFCCDCGKIFPIFESTWSHCRETGEGLPKRCEECGIR